MDEVQLQDVILDIVTGAIRSTDITVDFYRWSEFPNFMKSQHPITTTPLDSYTERMVAIPIYFFYLNTAVAVYILYILYLVVYYTCN